MTPVSASTVDTHGPDKKFILLFQYIPPSPLVSQYIYGDPSSWGPKGVAPLTNSLISLSIIGSKSISRQFTVAFGPHGKGPALTD